MKEIPMPLSTWQPKKDLVKPEYTEEVKTELSLQSSLISAISEDDIEACKSLIKQGVDVNVTDKNGTYPLLAAVAKNNVEIALFLKQNNATLPAEYVYSNRWIAGVEAKSKVKAGAPSKTDSTSVQAELLQEDIDGSKSVAFDTEVSFSAKTQHKLPQAHLLSAKKLTDSIMSKVIDPEAGLSLDAKSELQHAGLMSAIKLGDIKLCELLIKAGADVNRLGKGDVHALLIAVANNDIEMIRFLVARGATLPEKHENINKWIGILKAEFNQFSKTANPEADLIPEAKSELQHARLMSAIELGDIKLCELLIKAGADVNRLGKGDVHALLIAVANNDIEMIRFLVARGATLPEKHENINKWIGILKAEFNQFSKTANPEADLTPEAKSELQHARLMSAIELGDIKLCESLIKAGADVNKSYHKIQDYYLFNGKKELLCHFKGQVSQTEISTSFSKSTQKDDTSPLISEHSPLKFNNTPLLMAVNHAEAIRVDKSTGVKKTDIIKLLLDNGADVNLSTLNVLPIVAAIYQRDIELIHFLIEQGAYLNLPNSLIWPYNQEIITPILAAVETNNAEIVELLLLKGMEVLRKNPGSDINPKHYLPLQSMPYITAVQLQNVAIMKLLVDRIDPNNIGLIDHTALEYPMPRYGDIRRFFCAIDFAISKDNIDMFKYLLDKGLDIYFRSYVMMMTFDSTKIFNYILNDIGLKLGQKGLFELLILAVKNRNTKIVAKLLPIIEKSYESEVIKKEYSELLPKIIQAGKEILKYFINQPLDVISEIPDIMAVGKVNIPIIYAIQNAISITPEIPIEKYAALIEEYEEPPIEEYEPLIEEPSSVLEVIQLLVTKGADINAVDQNNMTPLAWASYMGNMDVAEFLINNGAKIDIVDVQKMTPLLWAIELCDYDMVEFLIIKGANINYSDSRITVSKPLWHVINFGLDDYSTDIHHIYLKADLRGPIMPGRNALKFKKKTEIHSAEILKLLISKGADVNEQDEYGQTPLMKAIENNHQAQILELIDGGARLNIGGSDAKLNIKIGPETTKLLVAMAMNNKVIVKSLIEKEISLNIEDKKNVIPLLWAIRFNAFSTVKELIKKGVDVNGEFSNLLKPLDLAVKLDFLKIARLLIEKGAYLTNYEENLVEATEQGNLEKFKFILNLKKLIERKDIRTLSEIAIANGSLEILQELLNINELLNMNEPLKMGKPALSKPAVNIEVFIKLVSKHPEQLKNPGHNYIAIHKRLAWASKRSNDKQILEKILIKPDSISVTNEIVNSILESIISGHKEIMSYVKLPIYKIYEDHLNFPSLNRLDMETEENLQRLFIRRKVYKSNAKKYSEIMQAVINNEVELIKTLVKNGANINEVDLEGNTPLMLAVNLNYDTIIEFLLNLNADLNIKNKKAFSALMIALESNNVKIVEMILRKESLETFKLLLEKVGSLCVNSDLINTIIQEQDTTVLKIILDKKDQITIQPKYFVQCLPFILKQKNAELKDQLLELITEVNFHDERTKESPLISAIKTKNIEMINILLKKGADVNYVAHNAKTPLAHAIAADSIELLDILLNHKVSIRQDAYKLFKFILWDCPSKQTLLKIIESKPDIDKQDINFLNLAALVMHKNVDLEIRNLFIKHFVNANAVYKGVSALSIAIHSKNLILTEVLLKHGADPNKQDNKEATPLIEAVCENDIAMVEILLNHGANITYENSRGWNALQEAIARDHIEITDLLLEKIEDINTVKDINIILIWSIETGKIEVTKKLIAKGVDVNVANSEGITPLVKAISYYSGSTEIVKLLLEKSADMTCKNDKGQGVLTQAIYQGHIEIANLLLEKIEDISKFYEIDNTILIAAVKMRNVSLAKNLIIKGVKIDEIDAEGNTPLFYAIKKNMVELTEFLLEKGADLNHKNKAGEVAFDIAKRKGNHEMMKLLTEHIDGTKDDGLVFLTLAECKAASELPEHEAKSAEGSEEGSDAEIMMIGEDDDFLDLELI